jgi:hypothetical protein
LPLCGITIGAQGHVALTRERVICSAAREWCGSDPGIPLVPAIFPEPALAAPQPVEPVDPLDAHQTFCVLVAELPFHPQPQRGAVADRKRDVVETMGEDGLRMESVDQVDAYMNSTIRPAAMKWIVRADWRPPNRSTSQGTIASIPGDIARPVRIISGNSTPMTPR